MNAVSHPGRIGQLVRRWLPMFALGALAAGCQAPAAANWQRKLADELPVLGHRNWIVIADSAYPAQTAPGVETIYTRGHQLEVVQQVLTALSRARHVEPVVHLDAELDRLTDSLAPGIEAYRRDLKQLLARRPVTSLPHEQLIATLDEAGKTFHVLILKTDFTLPYTTVFLRLDCGYWGPEQEQKLRASMVGK